MTPRAQPRARTLALALLLAVSACATADALTGAVTTPGGAPIPGTYVGVMSESFGIVGSGSAGADGSFSIEAPAATGYLYVQPPAPANAEGLGLYTAQPRMYRMDEPVEKAQLVLPECGCIALKAYNPDGTLLRWEDFERNGLFGRQFMFGSNLDDEARPAVCWPVYDEEARALGSPREKGLPALAAPAGHEPWAVQVLFWNTAYGKLHLRADNAGQGFAVSQPGDHHVIELNVELARTAVRDLIRRAEHYPPFDAFDIAALTVELEAALNLDSEPARANAADTVLVKALKLRDRLELAAARQRIPAVRQGTLRVEVRGADGAPFEGCPVKVTQKTRDFRFGVFEGSPYHADAFKQAREAGFGLATVLLGWNWTDISGARMDVASIESVFGINSLRTLGFTIKAHGVVWLQQYGILPERAKDMSHAGLCAAMLRQEEALLNAFGKRIAIWEAMNEPAATNEPGLPRPQINELLGLAAAKIKADPARTSLVNSSSEVDYGNKFVFFGMDNKPMNDFALTYSEALQRADEAGALKDIDVIALQVYPGFHFNEMFGGLQGPAIAPPRIADMLDRYAAFGKTLHVSEFSLPSSYGAGWTSGYWREPWTETTQADYAEAAFTLAFAHPQTQSISWWDITDDKPSVITGGMLRVDGQPKEVFERLRALIADWTTNEEVETVSGGVLELPVYGGEYEIAAELPDGSVLRQTIHVPERESVTVTLAPGAASAVREMPRPPFEEPLISSSNSERKSGKPGTDARESAMTDETCLSRMVLRGSVPCALLFRQGPRPACGRASSLRTRGKELTTPMDDAAHKSPFEGGAAKRRGMLPSLDEGGS